MHVHAYEKAWIGAAVVIIVAFALTVALTAYNLHANPPSHVETIDPQTVMHDPRFATPGVRHNSDGSATVIIVASMWSWTPGDIQVPPHVPVTFRVTSTDVIHGF